MRSWTRVLLAPLMVLLCAKSSLLPAQQPTAGEISPQKYEVLSELNQNAGMRDGVELKVDIFRPKSDERFPAIVYLTRHGAPTMKEKNFHEAVKSWTAALSSIICGFKGIMSTR